MRHSDNVLADVAERVRLLGGVRKAARVWGVHPSDVSRMIHGKRRLAERIANLCGYRLIRAWVKDTRTSEELEAAGLTLIDRPPVVPLITGPEISALLRARGELQ